MLLTTGASSCASIRQEERTAQKFLKAYLEADADKANRYLSAIYAPLERLRYVMEVADLPLVLDERERDSFGVTFLLEAHGTRSTDPILKYLIEIDTDNKVVEWSKR